MNQVSFHKVKSIFNDFFIIHSVFFQNKGAPKLTTTYLNKKVGENYASYSWKPCRTNQ